MPASPRWSAMKPAAACARRPLDDRVADVGPVEAGATNSRASSNASRSMISRRVGASAVAVSAMRGTSGKRSCSTES
jgi:hypothetical protein